MNEFGIERFVRDLNGLGYRDVAVVSDNKGTQYAVLKQYVIEYGRFSNNEIQLGVPVPNDYPRSLMASIHIKSDPILIEKSNVPNKYNIIDSPLGPEWRYWSNRFSQNGTEITLNIMAQINGIFKNV